MRGVKVEEKEWPIAVNHTKMRFSGAKSMDLQERTEDEFLKQKRCVRRDVWQLTKDVFKLKKGIKRYVPVSCRSFGNADIFFENVKRATSRARLWSCYAYVWREGLEFWRVGDSQEIQMSYINDWQPMSRTRRMKKRKLMFMIFTFSSLCSCSRILLSY